MKRISIFSLILLLSNLAWANDINLIINEGFEEGIDINFEGTWSINTEEGAKATLRSYEDSPGWSNDIKNRATIEISELPETLSYSSVYLANESEITLAVGDTCYLTYYFSSEPTGSRIQPYLVSNENTILFNSINLENTFNGMKSSTILADKAGTYQLRFGIGENIGTYITDNIILTAHEFSNTEEEIIDPINLIINDGFEDEFDGTWSLGLDDNSEAFFSLYEEVPSWTTEVKNRAKIEIIKLPEDRSSESVYIENESLISLNPGDTCYLTYYFSCTKDNSIIQPMLVEVDTDTKIIFDSNSLTTSFDGMQSSSAIAATKGTYKLRMCLGLDTGTYIGDNILMHSFDYTSDGAPIISSFSVQNEQQGDQGVNQIIGRVEASDLEDNDFTCEFKILSGTGSISPIDNFSFIYESQDPGEIIFKVTATDNEGNHSSRTASYLINDYDTAQLYFTEVVWELVRAENGYTTHSSFEFPTNDPELPNVLLFGNSVSIGYTPYVRTALEGEANVYRIPDNGGSTLDMFDNYKLWLGDTHWDVIHFNWGLHDLKYLLNNSLNINGTQVVPAGEYTVNMEAIVQILEASSDHLVFATISHVPEGAAGRIRGEEEIYNDSALSVMSNHPDILIDDQFTLTEEHQDEHSSDNDVHFNNIGRERQGNQAAEKILEILNSGEPTSTSEELSTTKYSFNMETETIMINSESSVNKVEVYDISGKKALSIDHPTSNIDLFTLSGLHILIIVNNEGEQDVIKVVCK